VTEFYEMKICEMSRLCSMHGGNKNLYRIVVRKSEVNILLEIRRC
jgi:hypothetical protein